MNTDIAGCYSLREGRYVAYALPTMNRLMEHSQSTWNKQFDSVERKTFEGGLPYVLERTDVSEDEARRRSVKRRVYGAR